MKSTRYLKNQFCHCWGIPRESVRICRRMSGKKILPKIIDGDNSISRTIWGYESETAGFFRLQQDWGLMYRQPAHLYKNPKLVASSVRVPPTLAEVCARHNLKYIVVCTKSTSGITFRMYAAP